MTDFAYGRQCRAWCASCKESTAVRVGAGTLKQCTKCGRKWGSARRGRKKW